MNRIVLVLFTAACHAALPPSPLASAPPPVNPLIGYDVLSHSDFFGFFHVHETGKVRGAGGDWDMQLEPGAYQDSIRMGLRTDAAGGVVEAHLAVTRAWLGDGTNPLACDLIGSFVQAFANDDDLTALREIRQGVMRFDGDVEHVEINDRATHGTVALSETGRAFLRALTGAAPRFDVRLQRIHMRAEQVQRDGAEWFSVVVEAN